MIQAAWRAVVCPKCDAPIGERCGPNVMFMGFKFIKPRSGYAHVARVAAGKAKRKGRNVSGSRARR